MSLQQNNLNKFPKHLQHVRLQKEEEEEQWISGEELCTEGSSDEENTNDIKKKFKSKPIHLPSKESLQIKISSSSTTSLSSSAKESDEENTDSTESLQKSPTEWRPKRGSIKLPNIVENVVEIDENNIEKDNDSTKEIKIEEVNSSKSENGFRSTEKELLNLQKIEQKLKTLQEMCDDADLKGKLSEDIYSIDEENREWKVYLKLTDDKFRRINDKINKLREQDDPKEKEVTTDNLKET